MSVSRMAIISHFLVWSQFFLASYSKNHHPATQQLKCRQYHAEECTFKIFLMKMIVLYLIGIIIIVIMITIIHIIINIY